MSTPIAAAGGQTRLSMAEAVNALAASRQEPTEQTSNSDAARMPGRAAEPDREPRHPGADGDGEAQHAADTPNFQGPDAATTDADRDPQAAVDDPDAREPAEPKGPPTIDIDGVTLTAEEIRRGYQRQADYTQKTQALSERAKALDASITRLSELAQALQAKLPPLPPKPVYVPGDPMGYATKLGEWETVADQYKAVHALQGHIQNEFRGRVAQQRQDSLSHLAQTYWTRPGEVEHGFTAAKQYALKEGVPQEHIDVLADVAHIRILDKARRWDELQASKAQIQRRVAAAPRVQRPGAKLATHNARASRLNDAWQTFLKNPTPANGAAYQLMKKAAARQT